MKKAYLPRFVNLPHRNLWNPTSSWADNFIIHFATTGRGILRYFWNDAFVGLEPWQASSKQQRSAYGDSVPGTINRGCQPIIKSVY